VLITNEGDEARPVWVVFNALDRAGDVKLTALEVDDAVGLLVTPAAAARSDASVVVTARLLGLALGQLLDRLALPELGAVHQNELAAARRGRIVCFQCHG